jgi:ApaG protein
MYSAVTREIRVQVEPIYLDDQSEPDDAQYVWAYRVQIENEGTVQEVRGAGVIGEQPVLNPGESYEYTSGTPLPTPSGIMKGSYQMSTPSGEKFDIEVPAFSLDCPHEARHLN